MQGLFSILRCPHANCRSYKENTGKLCKGFLVPEEYWEMAGVPSEQVFRQWGNEISLANGVPTPSSLVRWAPSGSDNRIQRTSVILSEALGAVKSSVVLR